MIVELKYGTGHKRLNIPDKARTSILSPAVVPVHEDLPAAFQKAMDSPLNAPPIETMPAPGLVAIAVSDESRPTPVKVLLPLLLNRLYRAYPRLRPEQIIIIVGAGLHPPLTEHQLSRVLPRSIAPGCRILSHDAINSPMTSFGATSRKTPVLINEEFASADLKIVIGNIDPHQFVGFTGGAKGAVIGCGAKRTIEANHSLMFHDKAYVANIEGNPVRMDIDEAGRLIGIQFAINVIMDSSNRVAKLLAGDPVSVYQAGAKVCASIYGATIPQQFDIAVASCGGHPKDICLYQAQKGLAHAAQAVKPRGKILLLAACPQGVGDDVYLEYVSRFPTPQAALHDFKRLGFKMGAHKAFLFARTFVAFEVAIASELPPHILSRCHLQACDPQKTLDRWVEGFHGTPTVAVIPNANTTYFTPSGCW